MALKMTEKLHGRRFPQGGKQRQAAKTIGIQHESKQRERPAQDEQDDPQEEKQPMATSFVTWRKAESVRMRTAEAPASILYYEIAREMFSAAYSLSRGAWRWTRVLPHRGAWTPRCPRSRFFVTLSIPVAAGRSRTLAMIHALDGSPLGN